MSIILRLLAGSDLHQEFRVWGPRFLIGRAQGCHLRPNCPAVSRHHCELIVEQGRLSVRDSRSKNGTYVNGEQVTAERQLRSGDLIGVGRWRLAVEITEAPSRGEALEASQTIEPLLTFA